MTQGEDAPGRNTDDWMWIRSSALFEEKPIWKGPHALWMWKEPRRVIQWERGTAPRSLHVGWKCCGQNSADVDDGWDWQPRLERFLHRVEDGLMSAFLVWLWPDTKQNRQEPSLQCSSYKSKKKQQNTLFKTGSENVKKELSHKWTSSHYLLTHTMMEAKHFWSFTDKLKHSPATAVAGDV